MKNGTSIWDQFKRHLAIDHQQIKEKIEIASQKDFKSKQKIKRYSYQPNELILVKQVNPTKVADKYRGPYRIIEVGLGGNRVKIELENKNKWLHLRNIKPYKVEAKKEGSAVVDSTTH